MFQVCTLEIIPYIFLCNDAIDIYIILTESHDQGLSNKPIYILRNTLVNEIHVEQSKHPKHLKRFWGHCIVNSLGNRHYYISFTDDCTHYLLVSFLYTKDETFKAYKSYVAWALTQHGMQIQ